MDDDRNHGVNGIAPIGSADASMSTKAERDRDAGRPTGRAHGALSSQGNKRDGSRSPHQSWPVAATRQLLLLLMSEAKRAPAPLIAGRSLHLPDCVQMGKHPFKQP